MVTGDTLFVCVFSKHCFAEAEHDVHAFRGVTKSAIPSSTTTCLGTCMVSYDF